MSDRGMEWQPIETAPRDGTHILLWGGQVDRDSDEWQYDREKGESFWTPHPIVGWWEDWKGWGSPCYEVGWRYCIYDTGHYGAYHAPTHWMPCPPPPIGRG